MVAEGTMVTANGVGCVEMRDVVTVQKRWQQWRNHVFKDRNSGGIDDGNSHKVKRGGRG